MLSQTSIVYEHAIWSPKFLFVSGNMYIIGFDLHIGYLMLAADEGETGDTLGTPFIPYEVF